MIRKHTYTALDVTFRIKWRHIYSIDPVLCPVLDDRTIWVMAPILGPTSTLMLHHMAQWLDMHPDGYTLNAADTGKYFGISAHQLEKSLNRLANFGCVELINNVWCVKPVVNKFHPAWVDMLPAELQPLAT